MKLTLRKVIPFTMIALLVAAVPAMLRAADDAAGAAKTAAPATQPDAAAAGPNKFYGPMTAIDTKANTFTVGEQTFTVTGESQLTKAADDSTATLADATVGEPARGIYTKGADGKLNVTKVRFGRKSGGSKSGGGKGGKKNATAETAAPATQPQ
jgi:hypothetical protein